MEPENFILEFGKDFAFVDGEYRVQVGNCDFFIDLLFFNRELHCLVAIEMKIGEFEPVHLGKMEFALRLLTVMFRRQTKIQVSDLSSAPKRMRLWLSML